MTFPKFCRRMTPDDIDMVSGAWARCVPPLKPDQREYLDSVFERIRASRVFDPKTVIGGR